MPATRPYLARPHHRSHEDHERTGRPCRRRGRNRRSGLGIRRCLPAPGPGPGVGNNARNGEPDLILAVEYKDYYSNSQQLAQQKQLEAFLASSARKMESQSGERKSMRKLVGGMELQELNLK